MRVQKYPVIFKDQDVLARQDDFAWVNQPGVAKFDTILFFDSRLGCSGKKSKFGTTPILTVDSSFWSLENFQQHIKNSE